MREGGWRDDVEWQDYRAKEVFNLCTDFTVCTCIKAPCFLLLCKIHKTVCPRWREWSWATSFPLPHGLVLAIPSLCSAALLGTLYLGSYKAHVGKQYWALWYFPGFPLPQGVLFVTVPELLLLFCPPPEACGFLPGQLQRVSSAEVQSYRGGVQKILFFFLPFSPLEFQETLELNP